MAWSGDLCDGFAIQRPHGRDGILKKMSTRSNGCGR